MRQAEKALRDAGWKEAIYADTDHDEEFYLLGTGALLRGNLGILDAGEKVLRAPRPEPEYEPGTVVWANTSDGEQAVTSVGLPGAMRWIGKSPNGLAAVYSQGVEVLRVIAYPDGSTPWIKPMGNQVDQIKVIDGSGYGYVNTSARDVEYAFEDDGKTLKIFTGGPGVTPPPNLDAADERFLEMANELLAHLKPHGKEEEADE